MTMRPKGKHVSIDMDNPEALGICDKSQFVFKRKDLIKQYEWRGNAIVWTGFYVGRPYVDTPNEQARPPILPPDPVPVMYPRLPQGTLILWNANPLGNWNGADDYWNAADSFSDGILALPESQRLSNLQNFIWNQS
jgi:hypothetical protein